MSKSISGIVLYHEKYSNDNKNRFIISTDDNKIYCVMYYDDRHILGYQVPVGQRVVFYHLRERINNNLYTVRCFKAKGIEVCKYNNKFKLDS